jgi:hypothetical protein
MKLAHVAHVALVASLAANGALLYHGAQQAPTESTDAIAEARREGFDTGRAWGRDTAPPSCDVALNNERIDYIFECNAHFGRFPDCINVPPWTPEPRSTNEPKAP